MFQRMKFGPWEGPGANFKLGIKKDKIDKKVIRTCRAQMYTYLGNPRFIIMYNIIICNFSLKLIG